MDLGRLGEHWGEERVKLRFGVSHSLSTGELAPSSPLEYPGSVSEVLVVWFIRSSSMSMDDVRGIHTLSSLASAEVGGSCSFLKRSELARRMERGERLEELPTKTLALNLL